VTSAELLDGDNNTQTLCPNCEKKDKPILQVRSAEFLRVSPEEIVSKYRRILVKLSISCSGNPANSNRNLKVRFSLKRIFSDLGKKF
jgi:hypothetical protein